MCFVQSVWLRAMLLAGSVVYHLVCGVRARWVK